MTNQRPSARAEKPTVPPPILAPQDADLEPVKRPWITAFAVVRDLRGFIPVRLEIVDQQVSLQEELHQPVNSMALAYEYLQGDVAMHYGKMSR